MGPIGLDEALAMAEEKGFDLVEVSPGAKPPVVKMMDYGKYKYEQQKKAAEARKRIGFADFFTRQACVGHHHRLRCVPGRQLLL